MKKNDPHRGREAGKYQVPVPSREYITEYLEAQEKPCSHGHLLKAFDLTSEDEIEGFRRRMRAMLRDGEVMKNRRGSYALVDNMELIPGYVQGHRDGFGFVICDEGGPDIFLPARQMRLVLPDDRVLVRVSYDGRSTQKRREGVIVEVLARGIKTIVGRFFAEKHANYVTPDNKSITQDILIPKDATRNAKTGEFVVAEIIEYPTLRHQAVGNVLEVLGDQLTPGMEVELALRAHELPFIWSERTQAEAKTCPKTVTEGDIDEDRVDLRDLTFVTIDGADARDFDDAIHCEATRDGWRLIVAIADVSHYVQPGSELDTEALLRGNSVYFPSRVIPMLPEALSNEICSLKPKVDRLVLACDMQLDRHGKLSSSKFYSAVIHSNGRLIYDDVAKSLEGEVKLDEALLPMLKEFHCLYEKLLVQRVARGALEFETTETCVEFDGEGKIRQIVPITRNVAHRMIEEAMLLGNVCASEYLTRHKMPMLYRVHNSPDPTRLENLHDFLKAFSLKLNGGMDPSPKDYVRLIAQISKREDKHLLQTVVLRSLPQAIYSTEYSGHFGLAYDSYTHFTSPIRRYPDLIIHRAIKHVLSKEPPELFVYDLEMMQEFAAQSSMTERRADLATREALDWLKCDYMQDKVGEVFDGMIVDVTGFGIFVELKDIYVQGLVHITALKNDYYHHDPTQHSLIGKRGGGSYRLGDTIRIQIAKVDLERRQMDFVIPKS